MRVRELLNIETLNIEPLVGMSEAAASGTEGTEAGKKPQKPHGLSKPHKPERTNTTVRENAANDLASSTTATETQNNLAEAASLAYKGAPDVDVRKVRFKDFLLRVATSRIG